MDEIKPVRNPVPMSTQFPQTGLMIFISYMIQAGMTEVQMDEVWKKAKENLLSRKEELLVLNMPSIYERMLKMNEVVNLMPEKVKGLLDKTEKIDQSCSDGACD